MCSRRGREWCLAAPIGAGEHVRMYVGETVVLCKPSWLVVTVECNTAVGEIWPDLLMNVQTDVVGVVVVLGILMRWWL